MHNAETVAGFRKSTFSNASGNCVEAAMTPMGSVVVADTKDEGHGPRLVFTPKEWESFLEGVQNGEFTLARLAQQVPATV